jgi:hypothetical protein
MRIISQIAFKFISRVPLIFLVTPVTRVADPHSFHPDPAFYADTDPDPIRIRIQSGSRALMTKNWKKITANKKIFFGSKTIYLSLGLHKERPSYRRSLQLSKEAIQHFQTWTFKIFSTFVGHFCPPLTWLNPDPIRIRLIESGSNQDPDPQPCLWPTQCCGSWFLPIPDPKTATKERGEKKFGVISFFVATNFPKL